MTRFAPWLVALAVVAAAPSPSPAQPRRGENAQGVIGENGFEVFRAVLDMAKIKPASWGELGENVRYDDMIVILVGRPLQFAWNSVGLQHANRALQAGGSVLIVNDAQQRPNAVISPCDVGIASHNTTRINGRKVGVTLPELGYQGQRRFPLLVPEEGDDPVHRLFAGLARVATQEPTYLELLQGDLPETRRVLARFPAGGTAYLDNGERFPARTHPFAVADYKRTGASGASDYRLLVMADEAVFLNSLMAPPLTDNIILAHRVVEYLQGPEKARKRCAFFEYGELIEDFSAVRIMLQMQRDPDIQLPNPLAMLLGNQPALTDFANSILDDAQTRDFHNTMLLGSPDNPGRQAQRLTGIATAFLVMASVWAAWFLLRRVWRSRQPTDNLPPPFAGGSVTADRSGGLFDRRKRELVRRNNLYEPVRDALRELFATAGAPPGVPGSKPPRVGCTEAVRKPGKLREAVWDLWKLAYGKPVVVTARRWKELEPVIDRLHRELADGTWWFIVVATPSEV